MEILWLRHFNLLLGGFQAVFSLVLTVVLVGIGVGSFVGGAIARRASRPAGTLMVVQALFVVTTLVGLATTNIVALQETGAAVQASLSTLDGWRVAFAEFSYNIRPMLRELAVPALLMGCAFPLANAVVQRTEFAVGRRAGVLYLANTVGAVSGSLVAGYVLLPRLGLQGSAMALAVVSGLAIVPLVFVARAQEADGGVQSIRLAAGAGLTAAVAIGTWTLLPSDYLVRRSLSPTASGERVLVLSEGVTEIVVVAEADEGRALITNNHPMSSTALFDQRYMRALAHIPLLMMPAPERALVIGFGVGNTTHAATLYGSVRRVEVAELSRHVLEHAGYFTDVHGDVFRDRRVEIYVNDGRQHLQMQAEGTYDLITLEPPPVAHAGVAALYSKEFYALARTRLKPGGYLTQWLPAYQVPAGTALAMVRAFVDVFPQSVLLSGTLGELLLVGTTGPSIEVDPMQLTERLRREPAAQADLARLELGTVREIVGAFVGSARTLAEATAGIAPVTDDCPLQEYSVRSAIGSGRMGVPASLFDLDSIAEWCPRCYEDTGQPRVDGLETYLALMGEAYMASVSDLAAVVEAAGGERRILGSRYLGAVVPDTAEVHNIVGVVHLRAGRVADAITEFQEALRRDPLLETAAANLGSLWYDLGTDSLEAGRLAEAEERFRAALRAQPRLVEAHNNLGIALSLQGRLDEAIEHFQQAVTLAPGYEAAIENLGRALDARRRDPSRAQAAAGSAGVQLRELGRRQPGR